jgi:NitT/TauT family transport system substrate-binding protein
MRTRMLARRLALTLALLIAVLVAACAPAAPGGVEKRVRLAISTSVLEPGISFFWIGKELGYFDDERLTVEIFPTQGVVEATQWVAASKVDLASPPPSAMIQAAAQGQDLGLIATYLLNRQAILEFVVAPDSPITSLAEIRGKKVGVVSEADEGHFIYRALMKELGYPLDANQVINTGQGLPAAEALKNRTVDVMIWADVQRALFEAQGYQVRQLPLPKFYEKLAANVMITRKDFLGQQRETLVSYLRALAKASLFFATNPDAALRLHYKSHPETLPKETPLDEAVEQNLIGIRVRVPKLVPQPAEQWGQMSKENWEFYAKEYLGLGDKITDVTQFYTTDLIADINKFDQQGIVDQAKNYKVQ